MKAVSPESTPGGPQSGDPVEVQRPGLGCAEALVDGIEGADVIFRFPDGETCRRRRESEGRLWRRVTRPQ
jgi:hypothetical protein